MSPALTAAQHYLANVRDQHAKFDDRDQLIRALVKELERREMVAVTIQVRQKKKPKARPKQLMNP